MPRPSARQRGYDRRWEKARLAYLTANPLCVMCASQDKVTAATVVDHIVPHKGDQALFWDTANWQSVCKSHHDRDKQQQEARGYSSAVDSSGWPTDPRHPANR